MGLSGPIIFIDYDHNYRRFEAWHAAQRRDLLQLSLQENTDKVFASIQPAGKAPLQILEEKWDLNILGISDDGTQVHLETTAGITEQCRVEINHQQCDVQLIEEPTLLLCEAVNASEGDCATITKTFSTIDQLQEHLAQFWSKRWWKEQLPSPSDWERMFRFCEAHLTPQPERHDDITLAQWQEINQQALHQEAGT